MCKTQQFLGKRHHTLSLLLSSERQINLFKFSQLVNTTSWAPRHHPTHLPACEVPKESQSICSNGDQPSYSKINRCDFYSTVSLCQLLLINGSTLAHGKVHLARPSHSLPVAVIIRSCSSEPGRPMYGLCRQASFSLCILFKCPSLHLCCDWFIRPVPCSNRTYNQSLAPRQSETHFSLQII